jgi:hypothetical protein
MWLWLVDTTVLGVDSRSISSLVSIKKIALEMLLIVLKVALMNTHRPSIRGESVRVRVVVLRGRGILDGGGWGLVQECRACLWARAGCPFCTNLAMAVDPEALAVSTAQNI